MFLRHFTPYCDIFSTQIYYCFGGQAQLKKFPKIVESNHFGFTQVKIRHGWNYRVHSLLASLVAEIPSGPDALLV